MAGKPKGYKTGDNERKLLQFLKQRDVNIKSNSSQTSNNSK